MKKLLLQVFRLSIVGLCGMGLTQPSLGAEFSPLLDAQLQNQTSDLISAIVTLPSPIDIRMLDLKLHAERAKLAERHEKIITALTTNAEMTQPAFRVELEAAKTAGAVIGYTAYWVENLFVIQASKEFIEGLRPRGDVVAVSENFRGEALEPDFFVNENGRRPRQALDSLILATGIRASGAYRVNTELGITGQGTLVANLDTGVDGGHPALSSRWRGTIAPWQECWRDAIGNTTFPHDAVNHGTPVMGTITGREFLGEDTIWVGCAPNALWIADNAINQGIGQPFNNDILDALQWFADPDSDPETIDDVPDVIANNWGVSANFGYPQCYEFWNAAILNCEAAGPVITWSAGAEGPAGVMRTPAIHSINAYQIFTTGSVDASDYLDPPFPITSWSTRGPTPCTPAQPDNIKPELVSPGIDILSCTSDGYTYFSGASFADGHTAGVVALMREACPDCDYITIKQTLFDTAVDDGYGADGDDNVYGHGFINAYAAVLALLPVGRCCYDTACADTFEIACSHLGGVWTADASCAADGCLTAVDDLTIHVDEDVTILRWRARPTATYYRIFTSENSEEPWTLIDSTTGTNYTDSNGESDVKLFYRVTANRP